MNRNPPENGIDSFFRAVFEVIFMIIQFIFIQILYRVIKYGLVLFLAGILIQAMAQAYSIPFYVTIFPVLIFDHFYVVAWLGCKGDNILPSFILTSIVSFYGALFAWFLGPYNATLITATVSFTTFLVTFALELDLNIKTNNFDTKHSIGGPRQQYISN